MNDLIFTLRLFRRAPGFVLAAVATLALGIGASTAMFTIIDSVLLRPLRFPDPERLVKFSVSVSPSECLEIPDSRVFEDSGCYADNVSASIASAGSSSVNPEHLIGYLSTSGLPRALGVHPVLGRWFFEADEVQGAPRVSSSAMACGSAGLARIRTFSAKPSGWMATSQRSSESPRTTSSSAIQTWITGRHSELINLRAGRECWALSRV